VSRGRDPRDRDHVAHNRTFWDTDADAYQREHGAALDAAPLAWGAYRIPEADLGVLGLDTEIARDATMLELGCGAAQWSVALAGLGRQVVGLDVSNAQLAFARAADPTLPLTLASGEHLPFRAASVDVVFGDHGALSFCDPDVILAECARILRPGGTLAFCCTHPLLYLTWDAQKEAQTRRLQIRYDQLGRMHVGEGTIDWVLTASEWIPMLRAHGFAIEDCIELCAPRGASTTYNEYAPPKWARKWPAEWIWKTRREAD
jgi:SAM-dependent methyltransferase